MAILSGIFIPKYVNNWGHPKLKFLKKAVLSGILAIF